MTILSPLAANIVAKRSPLIARNASALCAVIAWSDAPAGVAVLPAVDGGDRAGGCCIGSGHTLARAHGYREGVIAVRVNVANIIRAALSDTAGDAVEAIELATVFCESVACHEVAHAVVAPLDQPRDVAQAVALVGRVDQNQMQRKSADAEAAGHHPRWAAAYVVLQRRAMEVRPAVERSAREAFLRADLQGYGHDLDAVADALGDVAPDASLRKLLAPGSGAAIRVAEACRPAAECAAIIEHDRRQRAAGELGGVLIEGVSR
jgi:hypothetical protein